MIMTKVITTMMMMMAMMKAILLTLMLLRILMEMTIRVPAIRTMRCSPQRCLWSIAPPLMLQYWWRACLHKRFFTVSSSLRLSDVWVNIFMKQTIESMLTPRVMIQYCLLKRFFTVSSSLRCLSQYFHETNHRKHAYTKCDAPLLPT